MYQALYRKWRPAFFDDVVGQEHITSILKSEVENGKLSHAYLFCGPRGTGKTTCAKIIAKAANCLSPENGNPCGKCEACLAIDNGTTTDVIEMDAASNNGVDSIRELREGVVYTPADLKFRVYIIDEVHMLSIPAFNALLKTLEEPPSHVLFILATTELHKIPATVLSRCQRFDFHRVAMDAIVGRLQTVCKGEDISADEDALALIARLSQGGMRDSLNMLEYCAGDGGAVTVEKAERLLGAASRTLLTSLSRSIASGDTAAALKMIEEIHLSSRDIAVFWREYIAFCRDLLIAVSTKMAGVKDAALIAAASAFSLPKLLYILEIFMDAETDMQKNPSGARLYAEMALIRACDSTLSKDISALLERISALEDKLATGNFQIPQRESVTAALVEPTFVTPTQEPTNPSESAPVSIPEPVQTQEKPTEPEKSTRSQTQFEGRKLKGFRKWQEVVRKIEPTEHLIAPFLQMAYAYEGSDGKFYIFFESKFAVGQMTDEKKKTICHAINAAGGHYNYQDIIASVREDVGGIREPIEDLLEMDEVENQ